MVSEMFRRLLIIAFTIVLKLLHPRRLMFKGFQDIRFDAEFAIHKKGTISFGRRNTFFKRVSFAANGGIISVGNNCFFNRNCIIVSLNHITIGNECIFGPNVVIYDHDHRFNHEGIVHGEYNTSPVIIEDDCWVGANVTILRGTHIGEGCVIGAGAIVKGEIPPHSLVTSNRELSIQRIER